MFLELTSLFGLPAHSLLVHAAVVIVPLAVLALAATGWRSSWRTAHSIPVLLLALAGAAFAYLAKESGEPLERLVRTAAAAQGVRVTFGEHPEEGDRAMLFAIVFGIVVCGYFVVARWWRRLQLPAWTPVAAYAGALVPGVLALATMVIAGHSGAGLVWRDVGSFTAGKG